MKFKKTKEFINNNKGGTVLIVSLLVLSSILIVTLTASEINRNNLIMNRDQYGSTKAYFAAEAGAERVLWEIMKNGFDPTNSAVCIDGDYVTLSDSPTPANASCGAGLVEYTFPENQARYRVRVLTIAPLIIHSYGVYKDVQRRVELSF